MEKVLYVYCGVVILVVMVLKQNRENSIRVEKIERMSGISRNALKSWFHYFKEEFPLREQWQKIRGLVVGSVSNNELPGALLRFFIRRLNTIEYALSWCLQFFLTCTSYFTI